MTELLHNPNLNKTKLIPRKQAPEPKSSVSIRDFSLTEKLEDSSGIKRDIDTVTFDTTVRINNHIKNFLKAMTILGMASTQQESMITLQKTYEESLTDNETKTLRNQIQTLEYRDAKSTQKPRSKE